MNNHPRNDDGYSMLLSVLNRKVYKTIFVNPKHILKNLFCHISLFKLMSLSPTDLIPWTKYLWRCRDEKKCVTTRSCLHSLWIAVAVKLIAPFDGTFEPVEEIKGVVTDIVDRIGWFPMRIFGLLQSNQRRTHRSRPWFQKLHIW